MNDAINIPNEEKELLSELYGKYTAFNISKNNNIIIPGIYILSKPILINKVECLIITFEGLDKYSENLLFANQLRDIILILSSLVIYHGIDNLDITKQNFNNIFKNINLVKYSKANEEIPKEYMCNLLCEINIQTEEENNISINKFSNKISNKNFFKSFELINKHNKSQKSLNYKLKWINENFEIKKLNNTELIGNIICDLMENICEKFNSEEIPIIENLIDNILFSRLNEISEGILDKFKNQFNKYLNDNNNNQVINFYDLVTFYTTFINGEGISDLCKSTIASIINLNKAERYLKKIFSSTYDNIYLMYHQHKHKYEDLITKFGNNIHYNNEPTNIEEMKAYINTLAKYLKKNFIPIISYKMFNFEPSLSSKVNKYIINKLNFFVDNTNDFDKNAKKSVQNKFDEYNRILEEKDSKEIILEKTIRELKNKEREYLNVIEIEKKKYETLQNYFHRFENENQIKINDSQNKLNELIKENYSLKNKKLINKDDSSLSGIKSDCVFIKNKLNEFKNNFINYSNQANMNLNSNNYEQAIKLFNDNLEHIINNNFNDLNQNKEKASKYKEELDRVNFDMTKLKLELKEEQQKFYLLNKQLEEEKNKYDNLLSLFNEQKTLIKLQEEKIKLQLL